MPRNLELIEYEVFSKCISLLNIEVPDNITSIEGFTFEACYNLENITLPKKLNTIKNHAFKGCVSLKNIEIPDNVTSLGRFAFAGCNSLENITLPTKLKNIGEYAFYSCNALKSITLHDKITTINGTAFSLCDEIKELITPWGKCTFLGMPTLNIINNYLYLYANSILSEKYQSKKEFLEQKYIFKIIRSDSIGKDNAILKFKNLFYKMRRTFNINPELFDRLSLNTTEKFNLNTWNKIYPVFFFNDKLLENINIDMIEAFCEMTEVFGLFENDSNKDKRIQEFLNLFSKESYVLTDNQCNQLLWYTDLELPDICEEVDTNYLILKKNQEIPLKFSTYLKNELTEEMVKKIKKLSGTYGKQINDFVKENYDHKVLKELKLREEYFDDKNNLVLFDQDLIGHINHGSLHRMFDGCEKEFNEEFYNFFIDNLIFILNDEKLQSNLKNIQSKFSAMKKHYLNTSGSEKITLKQAIDYLENVTFDYHDGNYELSQDVKKAGVNSQEAFNYYQQIFEKNDIRKLSSLIKRSNIYEIDGYTIKAELLRCDDSFSMLVGETNYTNCCQVFGGVGHNCMAHAVNSNDGGIFVTRLLKDNEWILLTQSWDWQNNNVYCHDNIEGTAYLKNDNNLRQAVAKVYELDGKYIIEKSKQEVESYIKVRKKVIEKSLSDNKEKELQELRELEQREVIRIVTTGSGNDDLGLSNYFSKEINVNNHQIINGETFTLQNFQPVDYNSSQVYFNNKESAYTDSDATQYIIAGSIENLCLGKLEPLVPIYRDERRIVLEQGENIRNYTTKKIKEMEKLSYPDNMLLHQNSSQIDFEDSNIYLGEDWYMIYEEYNDNTIYVHDLAKINPSLEDESGIQNQEIMNTIYDLVRKYDEVEADLKEDTSYLLYLINKKLGYLEQIGEDISYSFNNRDDEKIITEQDQEQILKNAKKIKQEKNPNNIMHKITFKKGRLLEQENINNKKI